MLHHGQIQHNQHARFWDLSRHTWFWALLAAILGVIALTLMVQEAR